MEKAPGINCDGRTDWFKVKSGVKQRCNMFLFLLVVGRVMRKTFGYIN